MFDVPILPPKFPHSARWWQVFEVPTYTSLISWDMIVVDENRSLKSPFSVLHSALASLEAQQRLLLSATPFGTSQAHIRVGSLAKFLRVDLHPEMLQDPCKTGSLFAT